MLNRITLPGALFLTVVAAIPLLVFKLWNISQFPFGGVSLLIIVGVALETMQQIDSQLMMRNYEGFLRYVRAWSPEDGKQAPDRAPGQAGCRQGNPGQPARPALRHRAPLHRRHVPGPGERGTAFGLEAKRYMDAGELVPDDIVMGVVEECLAPGGPMSDGFILDGFPRNHAQAVELDRVLDGRPLDAVVHIDVPRDVVVQRLSERRVCERDSSHIYSVSNPPKADWTCDVCGGKVVQRPDDTPEAIERRLDAYERDTRPIREFYRESGVPVVTIDGVGPTDEVFGRLTDAIDGLIH